MEGVLFSLSIIIILAAFLTVIARIVKQPPIIAYLIAGILVGPLAFNLINPYSSELIKTFAHIGVAFLLFIVGLSLDFRVLKEVGGVSTLAGFAEIAITGIIGFLIAIGIGFNSITAVYIGAALAFSSTVVVVKILSDKKEIDTLHGKIALGILIVEDFVAAIALMVIPMLNSNGGIMSIIKEISLIGGLIVFLFILSTYILPRIMDYLAKNQEVLFLFGIAWALILASTFEILGFSLEIGALLAGMSLASSKYTLELGGKMKPLRDFFVVLFFVFFGSQLATIITMKMILVALLLSSFVIIGKPLIVMTILRIFGYKKRTNFLAGSSLAQISEFSLILALLGYTLHHISQEIMSLLVMVAIITIGASSYSIYYSHVIFEKLSGVLNFFEGKRFEKLNKKEDSYEIILIGYHRIGYKVLQAIRKLNKKFVVVDYNPKVILSLGKWGINAIYGDAGDRYFLSELPLDKAKLIISTIPDEAINRTIRERLKELNADAAFIATAEQPRAAHDLYEDGVDYVIVPHHLGGDYVAHLIGQFKTDKTKYKEFGRKHKDYLKDGKSNSNFD